METTELKKIYDSVKAGEQTIESLDSVTANELHPFILGYQKFDDVQTPKEVIAAAVAPLELEIPETPEIPEEPQVDPEIEARRVAAESATARETKLAELDAILDEEEPDRLVEEDKWIEWDKRNRKALRDQTRILRDRDTEDRQANTRFIAEHTRDQVIASIGNEIPELKLPKSLDAMNADYAKFDARLLKEFGSEDRDAAFKKYAEDPDFAKKVGAKPAALETLFIYLRAHARGGDLEGAILAEARKAGVIGRIRTTAQSETAEQLAERNRVALTRASAARPASGAGGGGEEPAPLIYPIDKDSARAWLQHEQKSVAGGKQKTRSEVERDSAWSEQARNILAGKVAGRGTTFVRNMN